MKTLKILALIFTASLTPLVAQTLPETFTHTLTSGSESYTINFSKFSSRGPLFEVAIQESDGSFRSINMGEPRSYIGTVVGQPGAVAAGMRRRNGTIYARITFESGVEWTSYGGSVDVASDDVTPTWPTFGLRAGGAGHDLYAADIFVDLTNRYYGTVGGTANDCMELVDFAFTSINLIYMRDVNIINRIGRVSIRGNLNQDPYKDAGGVKSTLLAIVNVEDNPWVNTSSPSTDHDLGTVMQTNSTGGLAGVGVIGTGASANGAFNLGDFSRPARHEFGHNWGMGHFDGRGADETNSPEGRTINSGNVFGKMSAPEMELVVRERIATSDVLNNLGTIAPDLPPRAADDRFVIDVGLDAQPSTFQPLANDNDSNGESLSILSVDSSSLLGASLTLDSASNTVAVTFPRSYPYGYDNFSYQISDASGRTSTAVVHLQTNVPKLDWDLEPVALNGDSLIMVASNQFEGDIVEYFFEHVNGGQDSGWQTSRTFIPSALATGEAQTYRVYARVQNSSLLSFPSDDSSAAPTETHFDEGLFFADTFDRTSLNGTAGKSGQISPANYTLTSFGNVTAGLASNQLRINGPAGSDSLGALAYIDDFNFGSPAMRAFDEVSVKVDIAGYSTSGSTRQMWLAVGQSLSELQNQSGVNPAESSGDLVVAYRRSTSTLEIYKNGSLIDSETVTGALPGPPTKLKLVYNSPGLQRGTAVSYEVFLDGRSVPHTSGTFTWSADFQNYISLGANLTNDALFDNLEIQATTTPGFTPSRLDPFIPDPSRAYYLDSPSNNLRIGATGEDADPFTTSTSTTGPQVEWALAPKGNGSWHIQLAAEATKPRLSAQGSGLPEMVASFSDGVSTYFDFTPGALADTNFVTLPDQNENVSRLQVAPTGTIAFVSEASEAIAGPSQSIRFTLLPRPSIGPSTFTPDPNKTYYIENPIWGFRLAANGVSEDAYTVPLSEGGEDTEWKFVQHSSGRWHIDRVAGGPRPRIRTDNTANPDMNVDTAVGVFTYYEITPSTLREGTFHLTLPDGPSNHKRLRLLPDGGLDFSIASSDGVSSSLRFVEVIIPNDYNDWAAAQSISDLGLPSDDFDSDGVSNDKERIFGLDPTDSNSNRAYAKFLDETGIFQYTRRNPDLTQLDYSIWSSTDLVNWTEDPQATQQSLSAANAEIETIEVTLDRHVDADAVFIQVGASEQP